MTGVRYEHAGVNIDLAEEATDAIRGLVQETYSDQVLKGLGLFSGFFQMDLTGYRQPVLVSSIDGVGTKVKIAEMMGVYGSVGIDLVHHCVNDIAVCGAKPLFFLDYIASDRLAVEVVNGLVTGMSVACKESGCALIAGETAEMPGVYATNNFDLAGAIVGLVEKEHIIDGTAIRAGDVLIGLPSSGIHTNGFSLVRKVLFEQKGYSVERHVDDLGLPLGEELLRTHKSYLQVIQEVIKQNGVHGISHITGGGIVANTTRLLDKTLMVEIDWSSWDVPPIFRLIQKEGSIPDAEMARTFNLGIGLVLVVDKDAVDHVMRVCRAAGEQSKIIGNVVRE